MAGNHHGQSHGGHGVRATLFLIERLNPFQYLELPALLHFVFSSSRSSVAKASRSLGA